MKPTRTATTTVVLGAPSSWNQDAECADLPLALAGDTMFSYWRPSWREWLAVLFGRPVRLGVFGSAHPPVSLDTHR